jgi:hypothetical protein
LAPLREGTTLPDIWERKSLPAIFSSGWQQPTTIDLGPKVQQRRSFQAFARAAIATANDGILKEL